MVKQAILAVAAMAFLASCGSEPPPSARALMKDEVQPTAEIYWGSAGAITDANGTVDLTPTTDEGWKKAQDSAVKLGELGKLLMTDDYAQDRGPGWLKLSQGLIDVSKRAEKAAIDRDGDAVFVVGGDIYTVCSACHQAYPATEAEAETGIKE
jgi:hypothetical protein